MSQGPPTALPWVVFINKLIAGINMCTSNPCGYRGHCTGLEAGFRCDCDPGYTGKMCQTGLYTYYFIFNTEI